MNIHISSFMIQISFLMLFTYLFGLTVQHVGSSFPDQGLNPGPWQWEHRFLFSRQPGNSWCSNVLRRPPFPLCPAVVSLSHVRGLYPCGALPQRCSFCWSVCVSLCFSWQKFVLILCWLSCYNFIISFSMWLCKSISCFSSSRFSWLFLALYMP